MNLAFFFLLKGRGAFVLEVRELRFLVGEGGGEGDAKSVRAHAVVFFASAPSSEMPNSPLFKNLT